MSLLSMELSAFWIAVVCYALASVIAIFTAVLRKPREKAVGFLMVVGWIAHTVAIGMRWERLGHLPVINIFEQLSANIWGLMAAMLIGYWLFPRLRLFAAALMPIILMLLAWILVVPQVDSPLPATYNTVWLYIHISFIKLFLGCAFVALGFALIILMRSVHFGLPQFARLPDNEGLDGTAYQCMALALIFDTLGVVAGAIWAQDAWGHYWSWDPLETWSLLTWLCIGLTLHIRAQYKTSPKINAMMILGTWIVAFFTFFGIPFVSVALHKGMI